MKPIIPRQKKHSPLAFLTSLLIHIGIALLMVTGVGYVYHSAQQKAPVTVKSEKPIIQAVAVDQQQIETEIDAIKSARKAKREKQIIWQKHLEKMAQLAVTKKQSADKQLQVLKALQLVAQQRLKKLKSRQEKLTTQNQTVLQKLTSTELALQQQQTKAKKLALQNQLAEEKARQKVIAQQQLINQIARYKTLILNNIGQKWIIPQGANSSLTCQLLVTLATSGVVKNVKLLKSSGNAVLDRSAITAVYKASPLPVPQSLVLFKQFAQLKLTVKPEGLLTE